jgi:hypothetical protein
VKLAAQLLDIATECGVSVYLDDVGVVKLRALRGTLTPELLAQLRAHKAAIRDELLARQGEISPTSPATLPVASDYRNDAPELRQGRGDGVGDPHSSLPEPVPFADRAQAALLARMRQDLRRWGAAHQWPAGPTFKPATRIAAGEEAWLAFTRSASAEDIERAYRLLLEDAAQRNDGGGRGA